MLGPFAVRAESAVDHRQGEGSKRCQPLPWYYTSRVGYCSGEGGRAPVGAWAFSPCWSSTTGSSSGPRRASVEVARRRPSGSPLPGQRKSAAGLAGKFSVSDHRPLVRVLALTQRERNRVPAYAPPLTH
jgi:hypothetical protein